MKFWSDVNDCLWKSEGERKVMFMGEIYVEVLEIVRLQGWQDTE